MNFFDRAAWPLHCGAVISVTKERQCKPTPIEAQENISETGITIGVCRKKRKGENNEDRDCGTKSVWVRHRYPGGWGPIHQVRDAGKAAGYRKRYNLARHSDIVQGSQDQWPYLSVKRVAGI